MNTDTSSPLKSSATKGTAVVTGASGGFGKIYADRLAKRGYDLILVARSGDKLEQVAKTLRSDYGVAASVLVADLSVEADLDKVAAMVSGNSTITLLVNNAGTATMAPLSATTPAQIDAMTALNVTALARLSHAVLPGFKERNHGTLINLGSVLGIGILPISGAYSATKGYVLNLTRALQEEVHGSAVIVQLVMPSAAATDIWQVAGVPLAKLDPSTIMSAENCVDAALAGLDQGELLTMPALEDVQLLVAYEAACKALFAGARSGTPASRYAIAK
jgi:short-subunit dehydrogenase